MESEVFGFVFAVFGSIILLFGVVAFLRLIWNMGTFFGEKRK